MPSEFDIFEWDGTPIGPGTDIRALFRDTDGGWESTASVEWIERPGATPEIGAESLNPITLPPLHLKWPNNATMSQTQYRVDALRMFNRTGNRRGLRYLGMWRHDGVQLRQTRIGCKVVGVAMDTNDATHFIVGLVAPGAWEDYDATTQTDPPYLVNAGTEPTSPVLSLTTTTHKTARVCTVTGIDAMNYLTYFDISDVAATTTNVRVYVNTVLVPSFVIHSGLSNSGVWARLDIARDSDTSVIIIYGSGLTNPLGQTLDDAGIALATSTNSSIIWDDIRASNKPGYPFAWNMARRGNTGGADGSFALSAESTSALTLSRYTDDEGVNDADSIEMIAPSGISTLTGVQRVTTLHAVPSVTIVTIVAGSGGANEQQRIAMTNASRGTFTLSFGGQTTSAIAFDATPADVQAALEALSSILPGNVSVTGGPLPRSYVTVEFIGVLALTNVAQMTGDDTYLLGGGVRSFVRAWDNNNPRGTDVWSTVADGTVSGASAITVGARTRVAIGIEYTNDTPNDGAALALGFNVASWTAAIGSPPTVTVGAAVDADLYDGTIQIGDAEAFVFDEYIVPTGTYVIDCAARRLSDSAWTPLGLIDYDPRQWLTLEPGTQDVTNTTGASIEFVTRSGWS